MIVNQLSLTGEKLNEDEEMMHKYGEQYADGIEWSEKGQGSLYYLLDGRIPPIPAELNVAQLIVYINVIFVFTLFSDKLVGSQPNLS